MPIHPAAIVDRTASIAESAEIGPYCVIGAEVSIGERTRLMGHVFVEGPITIGEDNIFYPYASVGLAPQDLKYKGERSETRIGDRNQIREFVTIHRGTRAAACSPRSASDNLLSAYTHVAHDVTIGNNTVLSHGATLGGHVSIARWCCGGRAFGHPSILPCRAFRDDRRL